MVCWLNGQFVEEKNMRISPFDHGFIYGVGFYELFRTYNGKVLLFEEHFNRLCIALNFYRITMPYTITELKEAINKIIENANGEDAIIRLNVSAGSENLDLKSQYNKPNVILFHRPLKGRVRGIEKEAKWLKTVRINPEQHIHFKSHYYGNNIIARFEIKDLDKTEGFFLTKNGFVAEGITSNIFWARDGILYTPALSTGIIPGITRQWVIVAAKKLGIRVIEDIFIKSELETAYECFTTNSVDELVPISNIGKVKFLGGDGPMYQRLHQAYIEEIIQLMKRG